MTAGRARADGSFLELSGGLDFTLLGSFDVGESVGGAEERSDLGSGTLGPFVAADLRVAPTRRIVAEAGIALGGLVKTEERYFGSTSDVGSTSTVWLRAKVGWTALPVPGMSVRVGGAAGVERMAEATGDDTGNPDGLFYGAGVRVAYMFGLGLP